MLNADVVRAEFRQALDNTVGRASLYAGGTEVMEHIFKIAVNANLYALCRQEVIDDFYYNNISQHKASAQILDALFDLNMQFEFGLNLHQQGELTLNKDLTDQVLERAWTALGINTVKAGITIHDTSLHQSMPSDLEAKQFLYGYPWLRALIYLRLFETARIVASSGDDTPQKRDA